MKELLSDLLDPDLDLAELFPILFAACSDLISISRVSDNRILAVNPAWLKALRFSAKEVIGSTGVDLGLWDDLTLRERFIEHLGASDLSEGFEISLRRKDGTYCHCLMVGRRFNHKGECCYLFTGRDITADKKAQQRILATQSLLVDAVESINEGFVLYDADDSLVICNSKFREFYGYSEEEAAPGANAIELGWLDVERGAVLLPPETSGEEYSFRRDLLETGLSKFVTVQLRDGRHLLLSDRKTDSGGVVSIQTDVTELKRAERELSRLRDEAVAANRAKSEFLAHMSHELRTPLNSILGFGQVMNEQLFGNLGHEKYQDYVGLLLQSGEHLLSLINDILDLSKVEAGELGLDEKPVELQKILESCIQMISGQDDKEICELTLEVQAGLPFFQGDERLLTQIFLNLLSNGVKFTDPNGLVTVKAAFDNQQGWRIDVRDTGCGMSSSDIPKALEPFGQVRSGSLQAHEGTGLGLSLSKKLTELHGGRLEIESAVGKGTTVTLSFPAIRALRVASVIP
ncbi:PAS domain-containing sensor histidine kinase [Rhodovibrionaceae bacterium A322]